MSWDAGNESEMANTTTGEMDVFGDPGWVPLDTFIGLILAFSSCLFIGISVIFKKLALRDIEARGGTRAVDGGYGYLRLPRWWLGISLMGLGELTNFVAYIFAPAILVTPLGVFSIVCTAALSPYFLKERLGMLGKMGCLLVLVGCIIVTLCGPKDREIASMGELQAQLLHPGFLIYAGLVVLVSVLFMALVPRYGHRYVLLYITICSSFGSLSVMFCKGVGLALKQTISGYNEFTNWATWVCLVALVACLLVETIYMQRALDLFNSSVFMSINYVLFTSLVIIASSILYTELREIGIKNIILTLLGFIVNIAALFLMHLDREENTPPDPDNESDGARNSPQITKMPPAGLEQGTPLLGRAPASPLAGLNLPHTMFPTKTNSCMSLISQASLSHHANGNNHSSPEESDDNHDDTGHHSPARQGGTANRDVSTMGTTKTTNNNSRKKIQDSEDPNHCHYRTPSGCLCEVPLITELHTSTKLTTPTPPSTKHCDNSTAGNNNNGSRRSSYSNNNNSSLSSQSGEVNVQLEDVEDYDTLASEPKQVLA